MKIIKVIVAGELPSGAYYCPFANKSTFRPSADTVETFCRLTGNVKRQISIDAQVNLCPDCPLRLEDNAKEEK